MFISGSKKVFHFALPAPGLILAALWLTCCFAKGETRSGIDETDAGQSNSGWDGAAGSPPGTTGQDGTAGDAAPGGSTGGAGNAAGGSGNAAGGTGGVRSAGGVGGHNPNPFDVKAFLSSWTPGTRGEDHPHGVPEGYDWYGMSVGGTPKRPDPEDTHMNAWGQIYVNLSDVRPPNTRVAVKGIKLLALMPGATEWQVLEQTGDLDGGVWTEDFKSNCNGPLDKKLEPDGSVSFVPHHGCNAHFWPNLKFVNVPVVPRAVLSMAPMRLVKADAAKPDDRDESAYIMSVGADWRKPDGSCPNNICYGVGLGKFVKPSTDWKWAVFSTLSSTDLATLPLPQTEIFQLPDGSFPR